MLLTFLRSTALLLCFCGMLVGQDFPSVFDRVEQTDRVEHNDSGEVVDGPVQRTSFNNVVIDGEIEQASYSDKVDPACAVPSAVNLQLIEKEEAALKTAGLADPQKTEIAARLTKARTWLQSAEAAASRRALLESQAKTLPATIAESRRKLAQEPKLEEPNVPDNATVAQLEATLAGLKQQVDTLEQVFLAKEKDVESRSTRLLDIAKEIAELEKRVTTTTEQVAASSQADIDGKSRWLEQAAKLNALCPQIDQLRAEQRYLESAAELLSLHRDLANREWNTHRKLLAVMTASVEKWRKNESQRLAKAARKIVDDAHPALRSLAEQNALIAEARIKTASGIEEAGKATARLKENWKLLGGEFDDLRQKVEYAGTTSSTGVLLRKKRSELPPISKYTLRTDSIKEEMPRANLLLADWKKFQRELSEQDEAVARITAEIRASQSKLKQEDVIRAVTQLLKDRSEMLGKAIPDQEKYLQSMNEMDLANQAMQSRVNEFREYLDQRVLWMRSNEVLRVADVRNAATSSIALFSPARWMDVIKVTGVEVLKKPALGLIAIAIFLGAVFFRVRLLAVQDRLCEAPIEGQRAEFRKYAIAFAITILIAARWPALMLLVGYRLKTAAASTGWTHLVGEALFGTLMIVWGCNMLRGVCRKKGIGVKLFRWSPKAMASIRANVSIIMMVGIPLVALLHLSEFAEIPALECLHRVLFIVIAVLFAVQAGLMLGPTGTLMKATKEANPDSLVYRTRHLIWFGATAVPSGFALLSILGFHYSAFQLSGRIGETASAILCIIFAHAMALRWLEVKGYNRAVDRDEAEKKLEQEAYEAELKSSGRNRVEEKILTASATSEIVSPQPEHVTAAEMLSAASQEFRVLLRYAAIVSVISGGWFIWADVLPALHILDSVEMWQSVATVKETVTVDGVDQVQTSEHTVPTTLTDVIKAVLICFGTIMIGRRLPSILELTVLERLPMDQGGRQAIAILVRYAATVAGLLFACHVIRVSWGSVQWLAAAMTVGLGFGLQEIFANLVSGIIILFERPIRAGDLVTVGDVTGNITKMQIRATTITDFDRRELIVPNKKFITDNVINWTLTDPVSRIVLPVGVAYGTSVPHVQEILLRIAKQSLLVMKEPAPTTLFKGFGDSTLNIELRVFIPVRDVYVEVVNELNVAIAREFEKANIEIAFPQRDLHIKTADSLAAILPRLVGRKAG